MDKFKPTRATISAFLDGEVPEPERALVVEAMATPEGRQAWDVYCRIGDALRSRPGAELSPQFGKRLAAALDAAAQAQPGPRRRQPVAPETLASPQPVATDGVPLPSVAAKP